MPFPKKENPLKRITVTVDPDDYRKWIRWLAVETYPPRGLIRRAMKEFLDRHRDEPLDPLARPRAHKPR